MRKLADRKGECELFQRILRGEEPHRIILVESYSGSGKSALLKELADMADEMLGRASCVRVDLKGGADLDHVFGKFPDYLGPDVLPNEFRSRSEALIPVRFDVNMSGSHFNQNNSVAVNPVISDYGRHLPSGRGDLIANDLRVCEKRIAVVLDTFNGALPETKQWIIQKLLPSVCHNPRLSLVLAGTDVPNPKEYLLTWGSRTFHKALHAVTSVDDWHEFALSRHPAFPRHYIEGFCRGKITDRPGLILEMIDNIVEELLQTSSEEMVA